jgi:hypothetical protein
MAKILLANNYMLFISLLLLFSCQEQKKIVKASKNQKDIFYDNLKKIIKEDYYFDTISISQTYEIYPDFIFYSSYDDVIYKEYNDDLKAIEIQIHNFALPSYYNNGLIYINCKNNSYKYFYIFWKAIENNRSISINDITNKNILYFENIAIISSNLDEQIIKQLFPNYGYYNKKYKLKFSDNLNAVLTFNDNYFDIIKGYNIEFVE